MSQAAGEGDPATQASRLAQSATRIATPLGPDGANGRMVWHQWGDAEAVPLVLLHGGSGSWTHWIRNISQLAENYRVLAADTPGLGDSDMPPERLRGNDYPGFMAGIAKEVDAGIRAILGTRPFHLCGFSMGSIYGTWLAADAGPRVLSLTLVGAAAFGLRWSGVAEKLEPMTDEMDAAQRRQIQRRNLKRIMTWRDADELAGYLQLANVERARVRSHGVANTDTLTQALRRVGALPRHMGPPRHLRQRKLRRDRGAVAGPRRRRAVHADRRRRPLGHVRSAGGLQRRADGGAGVSRRRGL